MFQTPSVETQSFAQVRAPDLKRTGHSNISLSLFFHLPILRASGATHKKRLSDLLFIVTGSNHDDHSGSILKDFFLVQTYFA